MPVLAQSWWWRAVEDQIRVYRKPPKMPTSSDSRGEPKNPSFWIKDIHVTLQYAELGGMWVPISFDASATVRLLGPYTLAGLDIRALDPQPTAPK